MLEKYSINTDFKGEKWIPKSIDVYSLNTATVKQTASFELGSRKKMVSDGVLTVTITTKENVMHPKATPTCEEEIANLKAKVDSLKSRLPRVLVHCNPVVLAVQPPNTERLYLVGASKVVKVAGDGKAESKPPRFRVTFDKPFKTQKYVAVVSGVGQKVYTDTRTESYIDVVMEHEAEFDLVIFEDD